MQKKSRAAGLLEMWDTDTRAEVGEEAPFHELIKTTLKKAGIPDQAYHLADYGLDVMAPGMESKISHALLASGLKAVPDGKGKIVVSK